MFKQYLKEWEDIYGFDAEFVKPAKKATSSSNEQPVEPFNSEQFLSELNRLHVREKSAVWDWHDKISWGQNIGALQAEISPIGSYKVFVRKLTTDLLGESIWVCKKIYSLTETKDHDEMQTAYSVHDTLKIIDEQLLDSPAREFPGFKKLVNSLNAMVRVKIPTVFVYEGVKEVNDNYTIIRFSLRGQGVEAPSARRVEEFHLHVSFDPVRGLIRSWGNDISSPTNQHKWQPQPSEFDEFFCPSQPIKEMVDCIATAVSTY